MPPKLEDAREVLLDILKWMDAHNEVLPKCHTKPPRELGITHQPPSNTALNCMELAAKQ